MVHYEKLDGNLREKNKEKIMDYGGSEFTNIDNNQQFDNNMVIVQKRKRVLGLLGRFYNYSIVVFNGTILSPMALFLPQSSIFLYVG